MAIRFSEKTRKQINELVASGRFANESAAVEVAVDKLASQERKLVWLKEQLAIAREEHERGELIDYTPELANELFEDAITRYEARSTNQNVANS